MSNSQTLCLSGRSRSNVGAGSATGDGRRRPCSRRRGRRPQEAAVGEYFGSGAKQAASVVFNAVARSNTAETIVFDTRACSRTSRNNFMILP